MSERFCEVKMWSRRSHSGCGDAIWLILGVGSSHHYEAASLAGSWRGASGGASLPDSPRRQKVWDVFNVKKNLNYMLREAEQVPRARLLATAQKESRVCISVLPVSSLWTPRALGLPFPLEWALMFVFPILAAAAGGWTVGVCMDCSAYLVLASF